MSTCRVGGCGAPSHSILCDPHWAKWLVSPEGSRAEVPIAPSVVALCDFIRRIEAEDRIDALRARGWMPPAEVP